MFDFMKKKDTPNSSTSGVSSGKDPFSTPQSSQGLGGPGSNGSPSQSQNTYRQPSSSQQPFASGGLGFSQNSGNSQRSSGSNGQERSFYDSGHQQNFPSALDRNSASTPPNARGNEEHFGSKDREIIISKLDAIRLAIQNIDHRLSTLENKVGVNEGTLQNQKDENLF